MSFIDYKLRKFPFFGEYEFHVRIGDRAPWSSLMLVSFENSVFHGFEHLSHFDGVYFRIRQVMDSVSKRNIKVIPTEDQVPFLSSTVASTVERIVSPRTNEDHRVEFESEDVQNFFNKLIREFVIFSKICLMINE